MIKQALKPTGIKILGLIVIFALIATWAFVPALTDPQECVVSCTIEIGYPLKFLFYEMGGQAQGFKSPVFLNLIIDLAIFYFAFCLISLIVNLGRRKNVSNSDSGRRDSSPANETGV